MVKLQFVCALVLFLANTALSFVLLTANMQDIKKIASNFVSDALAGKIAEFVMKATEQITDPGDGSAKNKHNKNSGEISNESPEFNANKQRDEKPQRTERYHKDSKETYNYKADYADKKDKYKETYWSKEKDMSLEKPDKFDHEQKKWHKEVVEISDERQEKDTTNDWRDTFGKSNEETERPTRSRTTQRDYWKKRDDFNNKISSEENPKFKYNDNDIKEDPYKQKSQQNIFQYYTRPKLDNMLKKPRNNDPKSESQPDFPKYESKTNHRPQFVSDEMPQADPRNRKDRFKTARNSDEFRDSKYYKRYEETTRYRSGFDFTTKKEKTDFDQYDNRNYPKADLIATSGDLILPRVFEKEKENKVKPKIAWWEKEIPSSDAKIKTWLATA